MSWMAIGIGAACGAWLRWLLGNFLNHLHGMIPLGTLAANLVGGYFIGIASAFFNGHPQISPEWKLFIITGFMGGLTTFSTFSSETVLLLQRGEYIWMAVQLLLHVAGAILLCLMGIATYKLFSGS